uniref:Uncharacterized protein n=1 Tax=Plectus sambesii TaxID=2011161 RepID=A0A914VUA5_9BILA
MIAPLLLAVGCLFGRVVPLFAEDTSCYLCASELLVWHWSKFFPHSVNSQVPMSDDTCKRDSQLDGRNQLVVCKGACFTLNVTGVNSNTGQRLVVAVARGCLSDFFALPPVQLGAAPKVCTESAVTLDTAPRRTTVDAEWCYCEGHVCNGPDPSEATIRSSRVRGIRLRNRSGAAPLSSTTCLILLTAFMQYSKTLIL